MSLMKFRLGDNHMSPNSLGNLTIVVVEDHDDARRYLGLFLDRLGATVVLAKNGFEALRQERIVVRIWWCPTFKSPVATGSSVAR
jgi:hypothetical protein